MRRVVRQVKSARERGLAVAVEDGDGACALALLAAGASLERANRSRPLLGVAAYKGMEEVVLVVVLG